MIPAHKSTIMIHCLDTPKTWGKGKGVDWIMKEVTRWHVKERKWRDVAYAAIVAYDGTYAKGRDLDNDGDVWEETGAGAKGWNKNVIHIAMQGGKGGSADDKFSDHFTQKQSVTVLRLIAEIEAEAGRKMKIMGHNEVAAKACPCFRVGPWYEAKSKPAMDHVPVHPKPKQSALASYLAALFGGLK